MSHLHVVTPSTTGYGDMLAVNPFARGLANVEAVLRLFYLAITVARLVTLELADRRPLTSKCVDFTANLEVPMSRFSLSRLAGLTLITMITAVGMSALADPLYAQYYPPPPGYGYPTPGPPPPCYAVTPGPFRGAARGAAGGAVIGAISGNAGRGAAIGAGFGALRGAVRRGSARSAGACY
jgi:hypothetical protein